MSQDSKNTSSDSSVNNQDVTIGGLNRENIKVVSDNRGIATVDSREIAPVIGDNQEHKLSDQFLDPEVRAQEQTALKDEDISDAQKNTQISTDQQESQELVQESYKHDEKLGAKKDKKDKKEKKDKKDKKVHVKDSTDSTDSADVADAKVVKKTKVKVVKKTDDAK